MNLKLFDEAFPGLNSNIARCEQIGFSWPSRPFVKEIEGEVISHVGFLDYPVLINGKKHAIGALHAICTKEAHRHSGIASGLIQEAITWAKERCECLLLFTEIPEFYKRLGFRTIQEHRFHMPCPHPKGSRGLLPLTSPQDDALFMRSFRERSPLSGHVWMADYGQIAPYNALFATYPAYWSLYYSPVFDGLLSCVIKDNALHLFDIIAKKIPSLDMILDHLPSAIEEVYFYFSPDLITTSCDCKPLICDNTMADFSGYLMAYGNWPEEAAPFMISLLSRC